MISFIIPAYNEEQLLGRTLASIQAAAQAPGRPFEVLVVDDASTDRTAEIARQQGARVVSVNVRQISAARNAGAREATGEQLIFVDADTVVTSEAVCAAVEAMDAGAVGGGCSFQFDGRLPLYGRMLQGLFNPLYRIVGFASGCFLFCTRSAFQAAGGFDETLYGAEEMAFSRALKRHGKVVVLRERVTTSGRKMRSYSAWRILALVLRVALTGTSTLRKRRGLELWYGERRDDPELPAAPRSSSPKSTCSQE